MFLRQSADRIGQTFGFDGTYFFKSGSWSILRSIFIALPGFLVGPVLARVFTNPRDIGIYDLVLTLSSLFVLGSIPGLQQLVNQSASKGKDGAFFQAIRAGFLGMLLTFPMAILTAYFYKLQGQETVSIGLLIVSFFLVFSAPLKIYESFLQGKKRFDLIAVFAGINALCTSIVVLGLALAFASILYVLIGVAIVNVMTSVFFAWRTKQFVSNDKREKGQVRYGVFLSGLSLIPLVAARIDKILLVSFFSPVQLGLYYFATVLPAQSQRIVQSLIDVTYPKIASLSSKEHQEILRHHGLLLIACSVIFSVILILLMPVAIPLLFTEQYRDIVFFAQLEAGSFVLFPVNLFLANMLTAQRRTRSQFMLSVIPSSVKIGAAVIAIPLFGILGVILVNFLSRCIGFIILLIALHLKREK